MLIRKCFFFRERFKNYHRDLYDFLNDEKHAEADIYTVYKKIMELNQKEMFRYAVNPNDAVRFYN